jgi:hypothetical protein
VRPAWPNAEIFRNVHWRDKELRHLKLSVLNVFKNYQSYELKWRRNFKNKPLLYKPRKAKVYEH